MSQNSTFLEGALSTCDSFQNSYPVLLKFKACDVNKIRRRFAMFCNQNRGSIFLNLGNQFCGVSFKSCNEFCFHIK